MKKDDGNPPIEVDYTGLAQESASVRLPGVLPRYWTFLASDGEQLGEREYALLVQVLLLREAQDFEMQDAEHPIPNPYEAWAEIVSEIARVHADGLPEFSHPLTGQVMRIFGWRNLCMSEEGSLDRAHFLKAYEAAADKLRVAAQKLPGPDAYQAALQGGAPARRDALPSTGGEEEED